MDLRSRTIKHISMRSDKMKPCKHRGEPFRVKNMNIDDRIGTIGVFQCKIFQFNVDEGMCKVCEHYAPI